MERQVGRNNIDKSERDMLDKAPYETREIIGSFQGGLNESVIFSLNTEASENSVVLRFPKSEEARAITHNTIKKEYDAIGATENGIDFRFRNISEQADLIRKAINYGLKVLDYIDTTDSAMLMQYIQGIPLHQYVQQDSKNINPEVIESVLINMMHAHWNGIVFGDRWATNTIIISDEDFVELDFDIELIGDTETVTSFELSQTLYHLMHFSGNNRDFMSETILDIYLKNQNFLNMYDLDKISPFLRGQTEYFYDLYQKNGLLYEEIVPPYDEVYMLIDKLSQY
ncbi:MAG TPA: hypothetical protein PLS49_01630 [Candidatus Woesebacteria bacterium]|nr:hypothetical protein [Candidatus Woesebacteria bacterium]